MAASMILAESGSKSWPMGVRPDRSRKHESTKTRRNQEPGLYLLLAVRGQRETPLFGNGPLAIRWTAYFLRRPKSRRHRLLHDLATVAIGISHGTTNE